MDDETGKASAWYNEGRRPQLDFSTHALERCQQRGISLDIVEQIYMYGTREWSAGALAFRIDAQARRRMDRALGSQLANELSEQARGWYVVVSADEPVVITVARQLRRKRR